MSKTGRCLKQLVSQTKDIKNFIFLEKYASGFWVHIGRCWKQLVSQTEDIKNFIFQEKHTLKSQKNSNQFIIVKADCGKNL